MDGKVYRITNLVSGKYYIGQTIGRIKARFTNHLSEARCRRNCRYLGNAIVKYGRYNFAIEPLATGINTQEELDSIERLWILTTRSFDHRVGYNIEFGGNGRGKISPETREKMSGPKTDEHRKKLSEAARKRGGHPMSAEARAKIASWHTGRKSSPETITKLRLSHIGFKPSPEAIAKTRAANLGHKRSYGRKASDSTKAKMAESQRRAWSKRVGRCRGRRPNGDERFLAATVGIGDCEKPQAKAEMY
jgi:group I intron endonuclease